MPFMDGLEMAQEIKKADTNNKVKIILLSADTPSADFVAKNIFDEIYVKPIKINKLNEMSNWLYSQNEAIRLAQKPEYKESQDIMSQ